MSKFRRAEDSADIWLREHDPYYTAPDKDKKKRLERPYETPEQERRSRSMEIPISNLTSSQRVQVKFIAGAYSENGDFAL